MGKFAVEGNTLRASGNLDVQDLAAFESAADDLIAVTEGDVTLDFSLVEFMPTSFIGELMGLRSRLAQSGRGLVLRPSPVVRQLLNMTGLDATITIVD